MVYIAGICYINYCWLCFAVASSGRFQPVFKPEDVITLQNACSRLITSQVLPQQKKQRGFVCKNEVVKCLGASADGQRILKEYRVNQITDKVRSLRIKYKKTVAPVLNKS